MTTSNGSTGRIAEIERILQEMAVNQQRWQAQYERDKAALLAREAEHLERIERIERERREREEREIERLERERIEREKREAERAAQIEQERIEREQRLAEAQASYLAEHEAYERQIKRTNREISRVSRMFGEGVEDWVASDIDRILAILYGCDEDSVIVNKRVKRRRHGMSQGKRNLIEIDVIADCESHVVFVEAKNTLRPENVSSFVKTLSEARPFFPEYEGYTLVGAVASLHIEESLLTYAMRQGLLVFTLNNGLVKVVNPPGFVPKTY